jgi:regulatory protein
MTPEPKGRKVERRPVKKPTEDRLMNQAMYYLGRFAASSAMLKTVLMRRVDRAVRAELIERADGAALVDTVVRRCVASGMIDDRQFAQGRAETLLRQGKSPSRIRQVLASKGVGEDHSDASLEHLGDQHEDLALAAATRLAQRRRLGPFRQTDRVENRDRDMAVLARAGHGYDVAKRVIDAAGDED